MFLSEINLPWPIAAHAALLILTGLVTASGQKPGTSPHLYATTSLLGITTAILGLAYLGTAYMPVDQNQFLYAPVPVRMIVGSTLGLAALVNGRKTSRDGWRTHIAFALYDGLSGIWLGWYLGRWDGTCPAY